MIDDDDDDDDEIKKDLDRLDFFVFSLLRVFQCTLKLPAHKKA